MRCNLDEFVDEINTNRDFGHLREHVDDNDDDNYENGKVFCCTFLKKAKIIESIIKCKPE